MKTIGHHTCTQENGREYVEANAPFFSKVFQKVGRNGSIYVHYPFLGEGYYFWDNNIELAKWWGERKLKTEYFVLIADLQIKNEVFLDLVGNRESMIWFYVMVEKFKNTLENFSIGKLIEHLKRLAERTQEPEVFPFKVIRAIDYSQPDSYSSTVKFSTENGYTLLAPRMMVCFVEEDCDMFVNKKIIFAS